jgi:hypothetical protein
VEVAVFDLRIEVEGVKELQAALRKTPELMELAIEDAATTLRNLVIGRTPVASGELKRSWSSVERTSTGFTFGTDKEYAVILEEGRYQTAGPRTVASEGGIYSRQAPGGIIGPILQDEALIGRIVQRIAEDLVRSIARAT